jgi:hypothetical protein
MRKAFRTSRLMGLFAIVFGLMAFGATAAQAELNAYWLVNGTDIGTKLLPEIQAKDDVLDGVPIHHTLLTEVGASNVEILCLDISFKGAKLHELGRATGKIHYNTCVTKLNGNLANNCKPKSPGATAGLIETNALDGLIKLHTLGDLKKDELVELLPTEGNKFATLELGVLCAIGSKFDITGKFFIKDSQDEGLVDLKEHLFEEGPLSALLFGTNAATIHGSGVGFLVGPHIDMTFAGHAA